MLVGTTGSIIPESHRQYFEDLPYPVKFVEGEFRQVPAGNLNWTEEDLESIDGIDTMEELEEQGVIIVNWGSASTVDQRSWNTFDAVLYDDNRFSRDLHVREILVPHAPGLAVPYGIEEGFILAEVGQRRIWYFTNLSFLPNPDHIHLDVMYGEPLRMARDPEIFSKHEEEMKERTRQEFVKLMTQAYGGNRTQSLRQEVNRSEGQLRNLEGQVHNVTRNLQSLQHQLIAAEAALTKDDSFWLKELEAIERHDKTESIQIREGHVTIYTKDLNLSDSDGNSVLLGKFRIEINLAESYVELNNLTERRGARDHPHVIDGEPCFGGHDALVSRLLADFELGALYEVLLQYLETFNPADDWGRYASYWFDAEPVAV